MNFEMKTTPSLKEGVLFYLFPDETRTLKGVEMLIRKVHVLSEPLTVREIAKVYQNTFGEDPWNEGYVCPNCGMSFPLSSNLTVCPGCLVKRDEVYCLVDYWPISKIITDYYAENSKDGALCLVAESEGKIIGFVWGYAVQTNVEFANKIEAPALTVDNHKVFYLDECAVLPEFQRRGVGKALVVEILKNQQFDVMILRTLEGSQMQSLVESLGGEVILSISNNRVIMRLTGKARG